MGDITPEVKVVTKRFSWEDLDDLVNTYTKQLTPEATEYLTSRGIEEKTVEGYQIGFEPAKIGFHAANAGMLTGYFSNCIVFPIVDLHGKVMDLVGRAIDNKEPKYRSLLGRNDLFFNHPVLDIAEDVILVRNLFDVLSLAQQQLPAVSIPDMSLFKEQHATWLKDKRVFICYPNDESGRRESIRIATLLENIATEVYIVHLPEGLRDVNDLFCRHPQATEVFMELLNVAVSENLKLPVFPDVRSLTVFTEEYTKRQKGIVSGISTGFANLDQKLIGGLRTGLYLVVGNVSSGKSTFLRQLADQIAQKQTPIAYVSWEMTAYELWCMSMARILQIPSQDILAGKIEPERILQASHKYAQTAKNMWTIEGNLATTLDEMEEMINRIIQSIGKPPVIIIDNLFRITYRDANGTVVHNNQAMIAYLLHQWSRQWDTAIIISAPLNKNNTLEVHPLVEASVDTLIHYEATPCTNADQSEVDDISLHLLKNRNGTGGTVHLRFEKEKAQFSSSLL
ncbi:DnaB-like helicase C-terminal domain-containing protein [Brevibacillus sp. SYSU BS000544]|uniref:DnaB-like helicase C-terminal domain-containing protein n=1 Tax=Brevibacillus sp. SYSU BS000544 TaxID=3416443 RepID=UPI003CE4D5D0